MEVLHIAIFNTNIEPIVKSNIAAKHIPELLEFFYIEMWKTWSEINYKEPTNIEDICRQRICNNSLITVDSRPV